MRAHRSQGERGTSKNQHKVQSDYQSSESEIISTENASHDRHLTIM